MNNLKLRSSCRKSLYIVAVTALAMGGGCKSSPQGSPSDGDAGAGDTGGSGTVQPAYLSSDWVATGGPIGGLGYDIRMHPTTPDIMYVTDASAGVFKSTDGGKTWVARNQGIEPNGPTSDIYSVFSLTIDPNNPDRVWAGDLLGGAYRTDDGAENWTKMINGMQEMLTIRGFTVEPGDSNVVYLAGDVLGWLGDDGLPDEDRTKGAVYKSEDGGQNWNRIWYGDNSARYVLVDPENTQRLFVSTGIFDRAAANSSEKDNIPGGVGVLRSDDGGNTWTVLNEANGFDKDELYFGSLAMHPQDSNILLAASSVPGGLQVDSHPGGLYRTSDGGTTWTQVIDKTADGENLGFNAVEFCEGDPSTAYASSSSSFYRSGNGGATWEAVQKDGPYGPPGISVGFPIDMQCDPRDAKRVFINAYGGGNFLSIDGGENWTISSKGYTGALVKRIAPSASSPGRVYASGPFSTQNWGTDWQAIGNGPARGESGFIVVDPIDDLHLLLALPGDGYLESSDGGEQWQRHEGVFSKIGLMAPSDFVFSPQDSNTIFALVIDPECFESRGEEGWGDACAESDQVGLGITRDGGTTWTKGALESGHVFSLAIAPGTNKPMYAAVHGKGVYRSDDHGVSWSLAHSNPLSETSFHAIVAVDSKDPQRVYVGSITKGLGLSTDGGKTWQATYAGVPPDVAISGLAVDTANADVVYASSRNAGILFSKDGGKTWQAHNTGLTKGDVFSIALTADGGVLYAGTNGGGVFRLGSLP